MVSEERRNAADLVSLGLTSREAEILHWLVEGKCNRTIAAIVNISKRTVEKHVENILAKLMVETRMEAALVAANHRRRGGGF